MFRPTAAGQCTRCIILFVLSGLLPQVRACGNSSDKIPTSQPNLSQTPRTPFDGAAAFKGIVHEDASAMPTSPPNKEAIDPDVLYSHEAKTYFSLARAHQHTLAANMSKMQISRTQHFEQMLEDMHARPAQNMNRAQLSKVLVNPVGEISLERSSEVDMVHVVRPSTDVQVSDSRQRVMRKTDQVHPHVVTGEPAMRADPDVSGWGFGAVLAELGHAASSSVSRCLANTFRNVRHGTLASVSVNVLIWCGCISLFIGGSVGVLVVTYFRPSDRFERDSGTSSTSRIRFRTDETVVCVPRNSSIIDIGGEFWDGNDASSGSDPSPSSSDPCENVQDNISTSAESGVAQRNAATSASGDATMTSAASGAARRNASTGAVSEAAMGSTSAASKEQSDDGLDF